MSEWNVETFARLLHEAERAAIPGVFAEWDELSESEQDIIRVEARWLMDSGIGMVGRAAPKTVPPKIDVSSGKK